MSEKNKELVKKINEAFSKGNTEFILANVTEDIRWNIVGMPTISGKNNFFETMKMMESASAGCSDISVKNVIAEGEYVVVESSGEEGKNFNPSYCDIYRIKNGKIMELTTYIVDTTLNSEQ